MSDKNEDIFNIRPAGRHILTIGRDLIQDPYAAVVELVKNSYDADASRVDLIFNKFSDKKLVITVKDNGHGMTRDIVTTKWMVPSTNDKQIRKYSPSGRILQGRKGIGRYASAILGDDLLLETVSQSSQEKTTLFVQWSTFEKAEYLEDVDILIETKKVQEISGTSLSMSGNELFLQEWNATQFRNLKRELKKLITPIEDTKISKDSIFDIYLTIKNFGDFDIKEEKIEPFPLFKLFDYKISGKIDADGTGQLFYVMQKVRNSLPEIIDFNFNEPTNCGSVYFDIRVYDREKEAIEDLINRGLKDESGNYMGKAEARLLLNENNGIGVYRNGFRIRPLGDSDFDWVELNKQRVQNPSRKIGSDQVIGIVNIESEEKSGLIEKSARDGLKENDSYASLQKLTKTIIEKLEEKRYIYRSKAGISRKTLKIEKEFEKLFSFDNLKKNVQLSLTRGKVNKKTSTEILNAIGKQEKEQNATADSLRETVAIYQGQATVGKIVNVVIHEGRKPLGFFKNQVPLFKKFYEQYTKGNIDNLPVIYDTVDDISLNSQILVTLFKKLDPLAAGKRGNKKAEIIKREIEGAFLVFKSQLTDIDWNIEELSDIDVQIICWKQDIYSVFTNLIENSIYWMNEKKTRKKNITVTINSNNGVIDYIDYKDSGPGIEKHLIESEVIFEPEFSTKIDGGTGLGLSIAGESARRFGFELKAKFSETGAYFRLERLEEK